MSERLSLLQGFVDESPEDPFPRYGLGMELRRLGRLEEADRVFSELRERFPDYLPLYLMRGQLEESLGRPEGARLAYEEGMAKAREQGDAHTEEELAAALAAL